MPRSKKLDVSFVSQRLIASTLLHYFPFTNDQLDKLLKEVVIRNFKKNQVILAFGEKEQYVNCVHKGMVRKYLVNYKKEDITTEIVDKYEVICSNSAFGKGTPSFYAIQAVEDSVLISITLNALHNLCSIDLNFLEFRKKIIGEAMSKIEEREILLSSYDAMGRFQYFIQNKTQIYDRVPQKLLASYLGIRPQTLSKIKRSYFAPTRQISQSI